MKKEDLTSINRQIISFLFDNRPHINELIRDTGLSPTDVLSSLTKLELNGIIGQYPGKFFL